MKAKRALLAWSRRDGPPVSGITYCLKKGEVMYEPGSAPEGVFRVVTGGIRLGQVHNWSKEVVIDLVLPGEHFCHEFLLGEQADYRAVAQVGTTFEVVDIQSLLFDGLRIAGEAEERRLRHIEMLMGTVCERMEILTGRYPDDVLKSIGSEMLADFLGCSRERVSSVRRTHPKLSKKFRTTKAHLRKAA